MKTITLSDITQDDFDAAAETVVAGIKAYNRKLDTRGGTVLRDLLVNPEAAIEAVASGQISEVRKSSSLKLLKDAQDAGEDIDQEDVDAILSNFNVKSGAGTYAKGIVKVVVSDGTVAYSLPEGAVFSTSDGIEFAVDSQVVAIAKDVQSQTVRSTTELYKGAAGWFFLVPVTATEVGDGSNIQAGTSVTTEARVASFVMAEAYKDFCGGSDVKPIGDVIKSIPAGLSIRGFVSRTATEGMLRDEFDGGDNPIVAVSTVGYGDGAQRRDRHNLFGIGVGGRIDVYVRNFTDANTKTVTVKGKHKPNDGDPDGVYGIEISPGELAGACWIKSVSDPYAAGDSEDVLSTLAFSASRTADVSGTWHDFDRKSATEAFNTVWQGFSIRLSDVPADVDGTVWSDERDFKVTAYCLPQASELQEYVDRDDVRSVSTDVVVRCPVMCSVSVKANVYYDPKTPIDSGVASSMIRSYINGLGFVGRLTRSEIVQILKNLGAVSVEMPRDDMLSGVMHDAFGNRVVLSGDALDVATVEDDEAMLTRGTVVFFAEERNVQVVMTPAS